MATKITAEGRNAMATFLKGYITHIGFGTMNEKDQFKEFARKKIKHSCSMKRIEPNAYHPEAFTVNGIDYIRTEKSSNIAGFFCDLAEKEGNGLTLTHYGLFGGRIEYMENVYGAFAKGGLFHEETNPDGTVKTPGVLYEIQELSKVTKQSNTKLEIVHIIVC